MRLAHEQPREQGPGFALLARGTSAVSGPHDLARRPTSDRRCGGHGSHPIEVPGDGES